MRTGGGTTFRQCVTSAVRHFGRRHLGAQCDISAVQQFGSRKDLDPDSDIQVFKLKL